MANGHKRKEQIGMNEKEEKRLHNIREKIAKMKNQEKSILAREKEKERKLRTRRLIQNGALAEKYLDCENMAPEEFENRLREIAKIINVVEENEGTARNDGMLEPNASVLKNDDEIHI